MPDLEAIPTVLDVPRDMDNQHCILTRAYQQVVNYQSEKKHDQPRGRFSWANMDQLLAKRLFCELSKETLQVWFLRSQGADDRVKPHEVKSYAEFVKHLLFYHDVFAAKRGTDFADLLYELLGNLERLVVVCSKAQRNVEFSVLLDEIHDAALRFCDHALGVVLLGTSANHEELEKNLKEFKQDSICVETIRRLRSKSAPEFWATDLGLVISATLVRGDNTDFEPRPAVWTDSFGTVRRTDCENFDEAVDMHEECTRKNQCAVLTGAHGEHRNNRSKLTGRVFHDKSGVWDRMNDRVTLHIFLQHGAVEDTRIIERHVSDAALALGNGDRIAPAALAHRGYDASSSSSSTGTGVSLPGSSHGPNASHADDSSTKDGKTSSMLSPIEQIKRRWQQGLLSYAGLAGPFRSKCQPLGRDVEAGAAERSAEAASRILEVPMAFSEVLCAFKHTLGAARHISGGGLHQSLLAIHGLRKGGKFESHLLASMQQFVTKASVIHREFESLGSKASRHMRRSQGKRLSCRGFTSRVILNAASYAGKSKASGENSQLDCLRRR
eukprot:TRINITY_DN8084_c0_g1_i1.p1 TRINITY_DN8084_c0_g1~~TRINITY_DN8084_c0_g1_i1.p1  ORF type:complete len:602 (+),score=84.00 TRINITY_DN8084_c0_g1_i1:149-1807(+)